MLTIKRYITAMVILMGVTGAIYAEESTWQTPEPAGEYELHHRADFSSKVKGIYISQETLEDRDYLQYLIRRSKEVGINTFIIDLNVVTSTYEKKYTNS